VLGKDLVVVAEVASAANTERWASRTEGKFSDPLV